jgi:hypothetical protein
MLACRELHLELTFDSLKTYRDFNQIALHLRQTASGSFASWMGKA